jgi:hypothetical protein
LNRTKRQFGTDSRSGLLNVVRNEPGRVYPGVLGLMGLVVENDDGDDIGKLRG